MSIYDQVAEGLGDRDAVFDAYVQALKEDPSRYRGDAAKMEAWAKGASGGAAEIAPDASGSEGQQALARIAARVAAGEFSYNKFFAVGLFRLLELAGAKDPKALGALVASLGLRQDAVNRDLMTYKGVLSKLSAAKEMMEEYLAREKRKEAARLAEKAAAAAPAATTPAVADTPSA